MTAGKESNMAKQMTNLFNENDTTIDTVREYWIKYEKRSSLKCILSSAKKSQTHVASFTAHELNGILRYAYFQGDIDAIKYESIKGIIRHLRRKYNLY